MSVPITLMLRHTSDALEVKWVWKPHESYSVRLAENGEVEIWVLTDVRTCNYKTSFCKKIKRGKEIEEIFFY